MRYFMIAVQRVEDNKVAIDDLSAHISQSPQLWLKWNGRPLIEIVGKEATVYIIDTYEEFSHTQHIRLAEVFVRGLYEVYSLITGETTNGKSRI